MSDFETLDLLPPDPILGLTAAFNSDPSDKKIDLSVGIYRNADLKPEIMQAVAEAEKLVLSAQKEKTYLPIEGHKGMIEGLKRLVFGQDLYQEKGRAIVGAQGIGGTGALRIGLDFLQELGYKKLYLPDPTWANHHKLGKFSGYDVFQYPYYDMAKQDLDFDRCLEFFKQVPEKSVILLHGCCHNPTGVDFTHEQWKELSALFLKRHLFPFFDLAYQGFGDNLEADAWAIRMFAREGHPMIVAQSCSKNFGLYGERVGALFVVTPSAEVGIRTLSHVKPHIRANYSNPPMHGAAIVGKILEEPRLEALWRSELERMHARISDMRALLVATLHKSGSSRDFRFLKSRKGLFSFTGLNPAQVEVMIREHKIYMTSDGRINICGINHHNVSAIAHAICKTLG